MAKYLDLTGLQKYHEGIKAKLDNKVDKVSGKGLSTNDYTTTEKNKLGGIASGAQVNVIDTVKVNGTALAVSSKAVDVKVPTKLSELENDEGFISEQADISGKEDKSNKVSTWSSTTSNTKYPSEKLVKDSLDAKLNSSLKGAANGVAELDSSGKVPSSQLPAYVDDVLEYTNKAGFPTTGESGKIYVAKDTNLTYRWSGSAYVEISPSLALGETSSTAYRGDRGKIAYDHSQETHAPSNAEKNIIVGVQVNGTDLTVNSSRKVNVDISGKEDKTNKITSWSSSASDTKYPSEKLVKGALDGKADKNHSHDLIQIEYKDALTNSAASRIGFDAEYNPAFIAYHENVGDDLYYLLYHERNLMAISESEIDDILEA